MNNLQDENFNTGCFFTFLGGAIGFVFFGLIGLGLGWANVGFVAGLGNGILWALIGGTASFIGSGITMWRVFK